MEGRRPQREPVAGLAIGSAVGRIALAFLVAAHVAYLLAPLIYVTNAVAQPTKGLDLGDPAAVIVVLLTDGQWFMAVGDMLAVVGASLLAATLASLLLGLRSRGKAAPSAAFFPGVG